MNFGELYSKVLEKLGENTTPQFWSASELKDYINRGFRQFARQTACGSSKVPLVLVDNGRYLVPSNMMKLLGISYQGKPIEQRSIEYLESKSGKSHFANIRGDTGSFSESNGDFRTATGNPEAWYFEDNLICLYPVPETLSVSRQVRTKQSGTLSAGQTKIGLLQKITTSKALVDLFIDGVYQNISEFSVFDGNLIPPTPVPPVAPIVNTITLNAAFGSTTQYEVVTYPDPSLSNSRQRGNIAAETTAISLASPISTDKTRSALYIDGIAQDQTSYSITSATLITLSEAFPINTTFEVVAYPDSPAYSSKHTGTLAAGSTTITFTTTDYIKLSRVDLFIDGVYQNSTEFTTSYPAAPTVVIDPAYLSTIVLNGSFPVDVTYEVIAMSALSSNGYTIKKIAMSLNAGVSKIPISCGYTMGINALTIRLDGITQSPSAHTEITAYSVQLSTALTANSIVEVSIYQPSTSFDTTMRGVFMPIDMVADSDNPTIPEQFHDVGWMWAVFEALSREGRGKDLEKASFYSAMFNAMIVEWRESFGEKAGPDYPDMPFFV